MPFYVLESFPINCVMYCNGPRAQVQSDELVKRLSFGETVEFLQAEVFVYEKLWCNHLKLKL